MSRKLAKNLGIGVGISAGANLIGAILQNDIDKNVAVTVFADDNKKYLSTELKEDIVDDEKYISSKVDLIDYEVIDSMK